MKPKLSDNKITLNFPGIGTSWKIDLWDATEETSEKISDLIKKRIEEFDKTYSRFRDDSLVTEISKVSGAYKLPDDASLMMYLYKKLYEITEGKVTPLIGDVLSEAGYDAKYSLKPKENISPAKKWEDVLEYNHPILKVKKPIILDFGAVGKGYLVDILAALIQESGIQNFTVNAGGDIAHKNEIGQKLKVGLEDPDDSKKVLGVAEILNQSICGSAINRRAWGKYHHIIDPKTLQSPDHILALWVVADTTAVSDGLSTALFFTEPEKLLKEFDFEYAIVYKDRTAFMSKKFPGNFFEE